MSGTRETAAFRRSSPVPGVRLVTERMPHVRSVSIGVWVDVGSRDESDDLAGAAHFLEHLLFKGTSTRSARDIAEFFDAIGGDINAFTGREHTCYHTRVLDEHAAGATEVLFDMLTGAVLRDEDLEAERKVILEEIAMAIDSPEDWVHDVFGERAWPGHPLRRPTIGTIESVSSFDQARMTDFYKQYEPGRLVVAASGNVDHEQLESAVAAALGSGGSPYRRTANGSGPRTVRVAAYDERPTEQVHLVWGGQALDRSDPDRYALSVLQILYGGGMSSRLFQEVRESRGLAYSIYSSFSMYLDAGIFQVYAGTGESTAATVLDIVREEARLLAAGDVSEEEVERAKGAAKGGLVLSLDDPCGRMFRLGRSELVHGEIQTVDEILRRVESVTREDVTRVAQRIFGAPEGFVLASVGPVADGTLDRYTEPL